jgi:starvation-inducible DNA-binding protein
MEGTPMADLDTGIDANARAAVADALNGVLADTYALYAKTHAYHWNVTGPQFPTLHAMFETQYREMWDALDVIAERIRALGAFATLPSGAAAEANPPAAKDMVKNLLDGHEALVRRARKALSAAGEVEDAATEDLLTVRIQTHEKTAWMLRATAA